VQSSDTAFVPPVCWYTAMTPEQMKAEILRRYNEAGQRNAGTIYTFYNDQNNQMDRDHYHQGQDGSWWVLTYDEKRLAAGDYNCPYDEGYFWRKPGDPPEGRITPKMLADAAYGQLMLPAKGVTLSPVPDNQKVNLPTFVRYEQAGTQVSVTAQLTEPGGQTLAATVVAQPYSLRVDAGTQYADPSTCDYTLHNGSLDSASAGCNITYRKASAGTYPMTADMTWHVWWTPTLTAQPDGTRMADGLSEFPQDVTVQEIQTVNR
jgi:enoyl reductase